MIRTKGEAGTGDIVNAVTHMRAVFGAIKRLGALSEDELYSEAKNLQAPVELVRWVAEHGRLPVVTFTAGGIATPADAALCMQLGADVVEVRKPEQLGGLDGLVIPGGESTTFTRLMQLYGLDEAVKRFAGPVFGTCAGMIVLDREHLGLVDLVVDRNAYGRQIASFEADLELADGERPLRGVFIRAPRVREVGEGVEVIAAHDGEPVLLRDGRFLVAAFHPELTDDTRVHERFLELVREEGPVRA